MVRIDAARRGEDDLVDPGTSTGLEDHAVERHVGRAGRLVQVDVATPAVVGGQLEGDTHTAHHPRRDAGLGEITTADLDCSLRDVLATVRFVSAAAAVVAAYPRRAGGEAVHQ